MAIKNGDGNPLIAGASYGGSVVGSYNELPVGSTVDVGEYRYYYFTEAINCTNGGENFKVSGVPFVTTWTAGGAGAGDNQWRFEPVDMDGMSVYDVGIFYKELTDVTDINTVANFADGWNGFYQVSNTASAYSSMDLQADNRIGFIYEKTLTKHGTVQNPVSTSFPTGAGTHNYDGFDNIYVAYDLEYITNGAYSIKRDVDRREFVRNYFTALVKDEPTEVKEAVADALNALSEEPTVVEIDNVYKAFKALEPADKWDGKLLTFTNIQQNGTNRTLYINDSNVLSLSTSTPEELGVAARFLCTKQMSGKYSFYNEDKKLYMIWRAGNNYGYNNNTGTLAAYNATYCDWSINNGSVADAYYIVSKRSDGTTDGSLVVMASGVFDAFSASEGYTSTYSNLFRIDVIENATSIVDVKENPVANGIYDLQGRKVEKTGKGIYIINGKKILVK